MEPTGDYFGLRFSVGQYSGRRSIPADPGILQMPGGLSLSIGSQWEYFPMDQDLLCFHFSLVGAIRGVIRNRGSYTFDLSAHQFKQSDLNISTTLTVQENQPIGTTVGSFTARIRGFFLPVAGDGIIHYHP